MLSKSRIDVGARDALGSILMYSLGLLAILIEFGDSSVNLELRFFTNIINDSLSIASDVKFEILKRFKEENIENFLPQRVMHMPNKNSGDK